MQAGQVSPFAGFSSRLSLALRARSKSVPGQAGRTGLLTTAYQMAYVMQQKWGFLNDYHHLTIAKTDGASRDDWRT